MTDETDNFDKAANELAKANPPMTTEQKIGWDMAIRHLRERFWASRLKDDPSPLKQENEF